MLGTSSRARGLRLSALACAAACMVLGVAACGDDSSGDGGASTDGTKQVKLAYIVKFGTVPFFVSEANGVRDQAKKLGASVTVQDVGQDANAALSAVDTAISSGAKGIAIVVPDQKIGPTVLAKAKAAGVVVVAIDDPIEDADGKPAPFVGLDSAQAGAQAGDAAVRLFKDSGFDVKDTKVAAIEQNTLSVCKDRTDAAQAAFLKGVPDFPESQIEHVPYDNSLNDAIDKMGPVISKNPDVKHWVLWSCNDEGVVGAGTALKNSGVKAEDILGAGLGGTETACTQFVKGSPAGLKTTVYFDGAKHGATATKLLYEKIANGGQIPPKTIIRGADITLQDYKQTDPDCK